MNSYIVSFLISTGVKNVFPVIMGLYTLYYVAILTGHFLPDTIGRRPILMGTASFCGVSLAIVSALVVAFKSPSDVQGKVSMGDFVWRPVAPHLDNDSGSGSIEKQREGPVDCNLLWLWRLTIDNVSIAVHTRQGLWKPWWQNRKCKITLSRRNYTDLGFRDSSGLRFPSSLWPGSSLSFQK
jgi:hypothetical protein